jgi:hypothetical protein
MARKHKILILLLFPVLITLSWFFTSTPDSTERRKPTTYSTAPRGAKALYLLLKELGLPVERFRQKASKLKPLGALVIYEPLDRWVSSNEVTDLKRWIQRGGNLVIVYGLPFTPLEDLGQAQKTKRTGSFKLDFGLEDLQLKAKWFRNSDRKILPIKLDNLDETLEISVSEEIRWDTPKSDWEIILKDDSGPLLVRKKMGKGFVCALSDPTIFSNRYIREAQNAGFALALLLDKNKSRRVFFDEYHHGFSMEEGLSKMVYSSVFMWIFLQLVVGIGLFFYSRRASHSGRFRTLDQPPGRSSTEYVKSMANVLESSKAGTVALEAILKRRLGRLSRKLGIPLAGLKKGEWPPSLDPKIGALLDKSRRAIQIEETPEGCVSLVRELETCVSDLAGAKIQPSGPSPAPAKKSGV